MCDQPKKLLIYREDEFTHKLDCLAIGNFFKHCSLIISQIVARKGAVYY